ncbi:MAG TPA: hypothetical protein PK076_06295 [Saprospiraceae bacterium]|nr:hypothetical protein [Saprospiraceae bacterium]
MVVKRIKIWLVLITLCFGTVTLSAQKYRTAAGIRIGTEFGLTVQQLLWDEYTLEGIVQKGFFNDIATASVLFEKHQKILSKGFNFYIGAGPHYGFYTRDRGERKNPLGVTAIAGIEMRFERVVASFDFKPAINIVGGDRIFDTQTALSLRYVLIKAKKKEQKWKFWEKWGNKNKSKKKK